MFSRCLIPWDSRCGVTLLLRCSEILTQIQLVTKESYTDVYNNFRNQFYISDITSVPAYLPIYISTWRAKKPDCFLTLDNFAMVSGRKACNVSKFSEFCLEKGAKLRCYWNLNILCPICINLHYTWNCAEFDNNAWILSNFSLKSTVKVTTMITSTLK